MRTLSQAALDAIHAQNSDRAWLTMLEIGDGVEAPLRLVANPVNVVSDGYTYIGFPFEMNLPQQKGEGRAAQIAISNIDRQIVRMLREMDTAADVLIRVALDHDPDTIEYELSGLKLRNVDGAGDRLSGDLLFEDIDTEPACDTVTPNRFPGAF